MNILHYNPFNLTGTGGVEHHIKRLTEEIKNLGHTVTVTNEASGAYDILHSHGNGLPPLSFFHKLKYSKWVHTLHGTSLGRLFACEEYLRPRGYLSSAKEFLCARFCDGVVYVSENVKQQTQQFFLIKEKKHRIIHNGADEPAEELKDSKLSFEPFFLFLGRGDDKVKNTPAIINAFKKIRRDNPGISLVVGPGTGFEDFNQKNDGIIPMAGMDQKIKSQLYFRTCALLLPSYYEADSLVLWEAMAHGAPIIASKNVGRNESLENYKSIRFVEPKDPEELQKAMAQMISLHHRPASIFRSWKKAAQETTEFYERILS